MCRLYGFLANEPTKVDCSLVFAQNALLLQSRADEVGRDHADGWGIGTYENGQPQLYKSAIAAFDDRAFSATAEKIYSKAIVAHVRNATVGNPAIENTHPFMHGQFVFAHNGTITGFESLRQQLEQETDSQLQQHRAGTTDSEQYFLWLLTQLKLDGLLKKYDRGFVDQAQTPLEQLLCSSVEMLSQRCIATQPDKTPQLNFIFTDGKYLIACRWNHSLYLLRRQGIYDCEICGIPHIHHHESVNHRAVVVASEPINNEQWQEFPNHHVMVFRITEMRS